MGSDLIGPHGVGDLETRATIAITTTPVWLANLYQQALVQIAVLTFDGFNELDSFMAATILNRMKPKGLAAYIMLPNPEITSMNGVTVQRQRPVECANEIPRALVHPLSNSPIAQALSCRAPALCKRSIERFLDCLSTARTSPHGGRATEESRS